MPSQKIAFVTGGNKGIGLETARQLGQKDVTVVIGARDLAKGQAAVNQLKADGINADVLRFDITHPADHKAAYDYFNKKYGRLDILINNAGISKESFGGNKTSSTSQDVLRETFDTNFFYTVQLTQTLLPLIRKSPAGRIVNLSSVLGSLALHSDPKSPIAEAKSFAYNASKTALNAFTIHLAHELRNTKIKVNSAHPGWVKTDMDTDAAPMEIPDGAKTSVRLALLPDDGPSGTYVHMDQNLPW